MAGLLNCLLRFCYDVPPDQEGEGDDSYEPPQPPSNHRMTRLFRPLGGMGGDTDGYEIASTRDDGHDRDDDRHDHGQDDYQRRRLEEEHPQQLLSSLSTNPRNAIIDASALVDKSSDDANSSGSYEELPHAKRLREFFKMVRHRWRWFEDDTSICSEDDHHGESTAALAATPSRESVASLGTVAASVSTTASSPMLRNASTFHSSRDNTILTIPAEQIVMPGSDLQRQMAKAMSSNTNLEQLDDECVICMEGFDPTNPRMPTLCGCGANKTYFHLPCLYQWIEQSRNCPSCRKRLRWEEF